MSDSKSERNLGIRRVAALHVFVRDLERSQKFYTDQLDFAEIGVSTKEFETQHRARASVVEAGAVRFVFMEPLGSKGESFRWLRKHPEGIGRVVFDVKDVEFAFKTIRKRGGNCITGINRRVVEGGTVLWFDIATAIGDTLFRFVEHQGKTPIMPELERVSPANDNTNRHKFSHIDHLTSNFLTLQPAISWLKEIMGFEEYWDVNFHTQDVSVGNFEGSGLHSVVMKDPESGFKLANNEPIAPFFESSQIFLYCEDNNGPGIQHAAIACPDLVQTVRDLQKTEIQFMNTPGPYYDFLEETLEKNGVITIDESISDLRSLDILVDGSAEKRYLMQIFLKEASTQFQDTQAGPFFLELIERKGDRGFGAGNFRSLFESIERSQQEQGRNFTPAKSA